MIATTSDIRVRFPALDRTYNGHPVAYFDAPGGTQAPREVAEAMNDYLFHHNANTHWAYPTSEETDAILFEGREAVADFLNASPHEIAFGANMTSLTFHLSRALGRTWSPGDEVIVTELDHHANVAPWMALEIDRGVKVRVARMIPKNAQIDYTHLASLVTKKTRLIAVGGASNAVGTVNDLSRIAAIAKDAGALFFVDAVHLAPHELIDVQCIGCDFLACSAYKFYGPHIGMLFTRRALFDDLPFVKLMPAPDTAPERAETGTQNHEGIAGARAAIDFLASLTDCVGAGSQPALGAAESRTLHSRRERLGVTFSELHDRGLALATKLWEALASMQRVHLHGPDPSQPRTPTVAFTVDGISAENVSRALAKKGLFASHGDFYAMTAIEKLGVEALVRIGCACYTNEDEIDRLIAAISQIAR